MLATIAIILLVLWALGVVTAHAFGGMIHILLIVGAIALVVHLVRRPKSGGPVGPFGSRS